MVIVMQINVLIQTFGVGKISSDERQIRMSQNTDEIESKCNIRQEKFLIFPVGVLFQ